MKTLVKIIVGLIIGCILGYLIGGLLKVLFTDTSWKEYLHGLSSVNLSEGIAVVLVAIGSLLVSLALLVVIHESGHLVCGLLTGYKFTSFRIFNHTLFKKDGKFQIKKFAVAGTGGQCLLTPPDLPIEKIPTKLYNFGGILANIMMLIIVIPLFFLNLNPFVAEALAVFAAVDLILIIGNGIPIRTLSNDGYNIKHLNKNPMSKQGFILQLRVNALMQNGMRPKDMPDNLFMNPATIDYQSALEVAIPLMYASRLIDKMDYPEALDCLESLYEHKENIMPLYVKEIACELAFLYLRTGESEKAESLLDNDLRKYIAAYRKTMSSKERIICAMTLYLDKDEDGARKIYAGLTAHEKDFLLQGEVKSDIALMEDMLNRHTSEK